MFAGGLVFAIFQTTNKKAIRSPEAIPMMAPQFEQASMLCMCIQHAAHEFMELIDRIEVHSNKVSVWSGNKRLIITAHYANAYDPSGAAMPGSGRWVVAESRVEA
jgi:hypothetical protein